MYLNRKKLSGVERTPLNRFLDKNVLYFQFIEQESQRNQRKQRSMQHNTEVQPNITQRQYKCDDSHHILTLLSTHHLNIVIVISSYTLPFAVIFLRQLVANLSFLTFQNSTVRISKTCYTGIFTSSFHILGIQWVLGVVFIVRKSWWPLFFIYIPLMIDKM